MNERLGAWVFQRLPLPRQKPQLSWRKRGSRLEAPRANDASSFSKSPKYRWSSRQFRGSARFPSGACKPRDESFVGEAGLTGTKASIPLISRDGMAPFPLLALLASERSLPLQGLVCSQLTCSCTCRGLPSRSENDRSSVPTMRCSFPTAGRDNTHRPWPCCGAQLRC